MTHRTAATEDTAREVDDEALTWAVRAHDDDLDPESSPELAAWLAGDPRRSGALLRAQAALSLLDRGRALGGRTAGELAADVRRRTRRQVLAAGGAVVIVGAGAAMLATSPRRYRTQLGEIRSVPLSDGSMAVINSGSALDVAFDDARRRIKLGRGEAWFEVAKDASRPFVVAAGRVRVRAVGTAFSVRALAEGAEVMVTEGVVESWIAGARAKPVRIAAGSRTAMGVEPVPAVVAAPAEIQRRLSWRIGEISLHGETLAEAAAEFNRYNERKIVIDDPALAGISFDGLFRTNEPQSFAAAVAATTGARVREDDKAIHIGAMI